MVELGRPEDKPPVATWWLASDDRGQQIVSVHVKKTYALGDDGRCRPAPLQMPLLMGPLPCEDGEIPFHETDVIPFKRSTDLIVMATAHGRGQRSIVASIRVGPLELKYRVVGDRKVLYRGRGSWRFSEPEPFDTLPIRYEYAYGGVDDSVPFGKVEHVIDLFASHPGVYPRNPVGRGYVVYETPAVIDGLLLPNVEDPSDLLTPERLVAGGPEHWWKQPLPWSCDWFDKEWYPRVAHMRGIPDHLPDDDRKIPEVLRGYVDPLQNLVLAKKKLDEPFDGRFADAASPALVLPFLRGDESIELVGMTAGGRIVVRLPGERPRMRVHFEGKQAELSPVPHRVLVSTEEMGVSIVWHGAWPTPRLLPRGLALADADVELADLGIHVVIDEILVNPLGTPPKP